MKKRLVVLLIVLICIWGIAVYYLFFYGKGYVQPFQTSSNKVEYQIQPLRRRLSESELERIGNLVQMQVEKFDFFDLYTLSINPETVNPQILSSLDKLESYKFAGFLIGEKARSILLSSQGKVFEKNLGETIDDRYLILHITSFGVLVLDVNTGRLLTIK
ncbi:hypothetical protein [Pseudothermotoga thermarum]|uniref:Uncharacterized protein n=1 Tax=Pseudothermotoga thermarum DSM 5069 TaxID=688269 RepID=F7YYD8_9THEM|nr:hypothetical protein [Pseudothermotoga thermarum]AEH50962.1 hypothetical protein Theth_0878 [Pseudothermotoga thermarum DSM 5069]